MLQQGIPKDILYIPFKETLEFVHSIYNLIMAPVFVRPAYRRQLLNAK